MEYTQLRVCARTHELPMSYFLFEVQVGLHTDAQTIIPAGLHAQIVSTLKYAVVMLR